MFDIGFQELLLIGVIGLVVLGPERLPETIRTITLWLGRFRRSYQDIKSEIEREVGVDEIRHQLHNENIMKSLGDTGKEIQNTIQESRKTLQSLDMSNELDDALPAQKPEQKPEQKKSADE